jgi:hypothetical protein
MKNLISILGLASLLLIGCSDKGNKELNIVNKENKSVKKELNIVNKENEGDIFKEIARKRRFEIKKYSQYIIYSMKLPIDGKTYFSFDLNKNGKMDLMATVNTPTNRYASGVGFDKNEDGKYEIIYADNDGDGYLETIK